THRACNMPLLDPMNEVSDRGCAWMFARINALRVRRTDPLRRRLDAARRFLESHLEEPLTLDEIARQAHLSKFHFLLLFRDAFHETPLRYLRRRRLEAARKLLTRTDLSVTDICLRVGFESLGSFSSLFRRFVGSSPNGFRRRFVVVP